MLGVIKWSLDDPNILSHMVLKLSLTIGLFPLLGRDMSLNKSFIFRFSLCFIIIFLNHDMYISSSHSLIFVSWWLSLSVLFQFYADIFFILIYVLFCMRVCLIVKNFWPEYIYMLNVKRNGKMIPKKNLIFFPCHISILPYLSLLHQIFLIHEIPIVYLNDIANCTKKAFPQDITVRQVVFSTTQNRTCQKI